MDYQTVYIKSRYTKGGTEYAVIADANDSEYPIYLNPKDGEWKACDFFAYEYSDEAAAQAAHRERLGRCIRLVQAQEGVAT